MTVDWLAVVVGLGVEAAVTLIAFLLIALVL